MRATAPIRAGKWKLVSKYPDNWELFDMHADRTEMRDLALGQPGRVKDMIARYNEWASHCGVLPWDRVRRGNSG